VFASGYQARVPVPGTKGLAVPVPGAEGFVADSPEPFRGTRNVSANNSLASLFSGELADLVGWGLADLADRGPTARGLADLVVGRLADLVSGGLAGLAVSARPATDA
jgi:hypothetical protein